MTMLNEGTSTTAVVRKIVYAVTERGERSFWTRVGAAFTNRDGSMTVRLDAMPMNGTLQIRDDEPNRRMGGGQ
jgi:hypothetical protein